MANLRQDRRPRVPEPWQTVIVFAVTLPFAVFVYANSGKIFDFVQPPTARFVTAVSASTWTGEVTAIAIGWIVVMTPIVLVLWGLRRALGGPGQTPRG